MNLINATAEQVLLVCVCVCVFKLEYSLEEFGWAPKPVCFPMLVSLAKKFGQVCDEVKIDLMSEWQGEPSITGA